MADTINIRGGATPPSAKSRSSTWQIPLQYIATLSVREEGGLTFDVSTPIDESFSISMGSQWNAPFTNVTSELMDKAKDQGGKTGMAATAAQAGMGAAGISERSRYSSAQVWQTSDAMSLTLPFTFIATTDPVAEVSDKVRNMLKLAAPSEWGPILKAPGPTIAGQVLGGRRISVQVGKFLLLSNCVVTRVDAQFDSIIGEAGIPLKAKVNVDVQSYYTCFTTQDIDYMFDLKPREG